MVPTAGIRKEVTENSEPGPKTVHTWIHLESVVYYTLK